MARDQLLIFTYHKTGTTLFGNVMEKLCRELGLTLSKVYGATQFVDPRPDVVMLIHSLLGALPQRPFCAVRTIRDPRDIWVSGYMYHLHCAEPWCLSTDFDPTPPIRFPRVPAAFHHRRERWKRDYLHGLNGVSYQENLKRRDRAAGLAFELDNYTGATMEAMRGWPHGAAVRDVKMEDIAADFDGEMGGVLRHLGFAEHELPALLRVAASEDVARMDGATLAANAHIHGRALSKWRTALAPAQVAEFERRYGDVILGNGYRLSGQEA